MSTSDLLSSLEVALGGICPSPKASTSSRLLEISVSGDVFEKLLRHWHGLPESSRPRLRGLTASRDERPARQLLLELGGRTPFLLVTVDAAWSPRTLAGVWPYAAWWEEELGGVAAAERNSGVTWRHA